MTTVIKYQVYCNVELVNYTVWSDTVPTVCPINAAHSIDPPDTDIIDELSSIDVGITGSGVIDLTNSTTDTLLADAIYTGSWIDVTPYSQFSVIYAADVVGSINMDISMDGSTVHR